MINFDAYPLRDVIEILLRDMTTGGNILLDGKQMLKKNLSSIMPRALKSDAEKSLRTRTQAEVFTPSRVVKFMVDAVDDGKIDTRWLEIACGEAPFITNRYDAETGEPVPEPDRVGVLDRKLRLAKDFDEAKRALQSVYGYELLGDSLIIARANVLLSFVERVGDIDDSALAEAAEIVAWNFFQFDALNPPPAQGSLFDATPLPKLVDWRDGGKFTFGG